MIYGIGIDMCEISRIKALYNKNKAALSKRILAQGEVCQDTPAAYAKRFAVKEAVSKALGTGIGAALSFHDIVLTYEAAGRPLVHVREGLSPEWDALTFHVSITDEAGLATAYVVAEKK